MNEVISSEIMFLLGLVELNTGISRDFVRWSEHLLCIEVYFALT